MNINADQIKAGRERRQITQAQLADELGVSMRTVGSWERGDSVPRNKMTALIEALGLQEETAGYQWSNQELRQRVGTLAKQRREELGLSRDAMAERAGLKTKQSVMNFEFARSLPRGENLRSIERALEWKIGSIDDALESGRRASDLSMEDFDLFDRTPKARPLSGFSTEALLEEVIFRLDSIKGALGPSRTMAAPAPMDNQFLYGLAASGNSEHLEDAEDDQD